MSENRAPRRWLQALAALPVGAGVVLAAAYGPDLLRDMDMFQVAEVEVVGVRYLEPYAVIQAAGIDAGSSVFDARGDWCAGVIALPLIEEARVRRRLPSTITIEVREAVPVALVAEAELRPVDAMGRILALEPAGTIMDLPIVTGATVEDGWLVGVGAAAALRFLELVGNHPGDWRDRVSQVELMPTGLRIVFRGDGPDALFPLRPTDMHVTQLRLAYADLSARGELGRARRIDVRFRDQVVVSFLRTPVS